MSYTAIALILVGVSYILIELGTRIDFKFIKDKVPALEYLFYIIAGWMCLATVNVGVVLNQTFSYGLGSTIGVYFKALLWIMITTSIIFVLSILFQGFKILYEVFK